MKIVALISILLAACASAQQPDSTAVVRPFPRYPVLVVHNETMQTIRVYDQGFAVASVLPGDSTVTVLPGHGDRTLTVRWLGASIQTESNAFETNRAWTLTIDHAGRAWLFLR
jgi:hypothetical protein